MKKTIGVMLFVLLASCWAGLAQRVKDDRAMEILAQAAASLQGSAPMIRTVKAEGTYTRYFSKDGKEIYKVKMSAVLPDQVRWDVSDASEKTVTNVVVGNTGWISSDGKKRILGLGELDGKGLEKFPLLLFAGWLESGNVNPTYEGETAESGTKLLHLKLERILDREDKNEELRQLEAMTRTDWSFSADTGLPIVMRWYQNPKRYGQSLPIDLLFSDYRDFEGALIPATIKMAIRENCIGAIQLEKVQWNADVTAKEFKE